MTVYKILAIAFICVMLLPSLASAETGAASGETITVTLTETDEAFANPIKGFAPARHIGVAAFAPHEYATVYKHYIKYTDLEISPDDTAQKIIDWSNAAWAGIEKRNVKVVPRVVIVYPNGPDNGDDGYWAEGYDTSDFADRWVNDNNLARMAAFVAKLGEAWNNDPRVAAIEMGIWGKWGEQHVWPLNIPGYGNRIPRKVQAVLGDAFAAAFPDKKIMVRYAETFADYNVGFYWDSFALRDDRLSGLMMIDRDAWRTEIMGGEIAYDWGDQRVVGWSPDGTLASDECTDNVIDWIRKTHTSILGWVANYTQGDASLAANATRMQKAFGYRYVIRQASYQPVTQPGEAFELAFYVENVGNAPFYYQWPVEVSLLDGERRPVWHETVDVDIRSWLPGNTYTARGSFTLPTDLPLGDYILALAILDPSGNLPSLRFANTNYYAGGRTPLGAIGIGQTPAFTDIGPFDSLYSDRTLHYSLNED